MRTCSSLIQLESLQRKRHSWVWKRKTAVTPIWGFNLQTLHRIQSLLHFTQLALKAAVWRPASLAYPPPERDQPTMTEKLTWRGCLQMGMDTFLTLNKTALSAFLWESMGRSPCKRCDQGCRWPRRVCVCACVHACVPVHVWACVCVCACTCACVGVCSKVTSIDGLGSYLTPLQVFCVW